MGLGLETAQHFRLLGRRLESAEEHGGGEVGVDDDCMCGKRAALLHEIEGHSGGDVKWRSKRRNKRNVRDEEKMREGGVIAYTNDAEGHP